MLDRFRAASPDRQLQVVGAGVCLLAVLLATAWFTFLRTPYQPLFSDLRTSDASTIVTALERRKIPYRLANGGATILVPSELVDSTRLGVIGEDMPLKGTVGFELFNKSDMGLTDFAQKINYQRALQGELARTLMTLDGVDTARVHLSLGEDRLFRDDQVAPKASVTIRMAKGTVLTESAAQGIKRLVAAAVPKLEVSDVVILGEQGQIVSAGAPAVSMRAESPVQQEKRAIEAYYEGRIREIFSGAGLPANIAVNVEALIDAGGDAQSATGLSAWSPGARNFPLQVTLSPAAALDTETQDKVRSEAVKGIATAGTQDDVVVFGIMPVDVATVVVDARRRTDQERAAAPLTGPMAWDNEQARFFDWTLVVIPLLIVLLAAFLLAGKLRGPRRLSKKRQADFVARLRAVLEEGDGRAASRS